MIECNALGSLASHPMGKKEDFIHIRSDEELKKALEASAARSDRKITDQARFILRLALGLSEEGDEVERVKANLKRLKVVPEKRNEKGGRSQN